MHKNENNNQYKQEHSLRMSVLVMEKLEVQKRSPTPKAYFVLRNVLMWSLAIFTLVFGALSISGILFRLSNIGSILPDPLRFSHVIDVFRLFPLFWVVVFGLFVYVAYLEIRQTKQGYKYDLSWIVGAMFIMSTLLGIFLYYLGVGFILDKVASRYVPFSSDIEMIQKNQWFSPEKGFLVGQVIQAKDEQEVFVLRDPDGVLWEVLFSEALTDAEKDIIREGRTVGLQGMISENDKYMFIVCKIRSVEIQGRGRFVLPVSHVQSIIEIKTGTSSERNYLKLRTNVCEGVRPL